MDSIPRLRALAIELKAEAEKDLENTPTNDLVLQLMEATEELNDKLNGRLTQVLQSAQRILQSSKTCEDLAKHGITESGMYSIDPDGFGTGAEPVMARCDFTTNTTEILHDHEEPDDILRYVFLSFTTSVLHLLIELDVECFSKEEDVIKLVWNTVHP